VKNEIPEPKIYKPCKIAYIQSLQGYRPEDVPFNPQVHNSLPMIHDGNDSAAYKHTKHADFSGRSSDFRIILLVRLPIGL
jgi:hypothetical protein